jgi:hypothetical protein
MGGASLAGAAISSHAASKAAKTTAAAAERASQQGLEAARIAADATRATAADSNKLSRDVLAQNQSNLNPFMQTGGAANDALRGFLGLPVYTGETEKDFTSYVDSNPDILKNFEQYGDQFGGDKEAFGQWFSEQYGGMNPAKVGERPVEDTKAGARSAEAFQNYRDSVGYDFTKQEGINALDQSAVARGALGSGKAVKSAVKYGSDLAQTYTQNYLDRLTGQQGVGLSAANALATGNNNFAANVNATNANATNSINQSALNATGNANNALIGAANTSANAGLANANALTNLLGQGVSAYGAYKGGSSYGATPAPYSAPVIDQYSGVY